MKFKLYTVASNYRDESREHMESLGFTMVREEKPLYTTLPLAKSGSPSVNIESVDDLMEFVRKQGEVIVSISRTNNNPYADTEGEPPVPSITIYDDHES